MNGQYPARQVKRRTVIHGERMKKTEILKNLAAATIPVSLALFGIGWLVFRNVAFAAALPIIFFTASLRSNICKYRKDIKRESAGVTKKKYKATRAYELLAPDDSVGPSICMEIENDKYLLMNGQWIYERNMYGEDAREYHDEESDYFNGYNPPYSFPSTEFEIWVSNLDGQPSNIIVLGEYLAPTEVNWPTPERYWRNSYTVIDKAELNMNSDA